MYISMYDFISLLLRMCDVEGVGVEHGNINFFKLAWITREGIT